MEASPPVLERAMTEHRKWNPIRIGGTVPNFEAESSEGMVDAYKYFGNCWGMLCAHPRKINAVSTSELGRVAALRPQWMHRDVKTLALCINNTGNVTKWIKEINESQGVTMDFPIIADSDAKVATMLGMIEAGGADNIAKDATITVRAIYLISPEKKLAAGLLYPSCTGYHFAEILRLFDSLQACANHPIATPVDWKKGESCLVSAKMSTEEAERRFQGVRIIRYYMRTCKDPTWISTAESGSDSENSLKSAGGSDRGTRSSSATQATLTDVADGNADLLGSTPEGKNKPSPGSMNEPSLGSMNEADTGSNVLRIGDRCPDFKAQTSQGEIEFHKYLGGKWGVLFSHPADFTPVCATELGRVAQLQKMWDMRGVKVVGLSVNSLQEHKPWIEDINMIADTKVEYPIIADSDRKVATMFGMLSPSYVNDKNLPYTVRSVFIIGPDKLIKLVLTYPDSTGRNYQEILRALDSLQSHAQFGVTTPADWAPGKHVFIGPNTTEEQASKLPKGKRVILPYMHIIKDPVSRRSALQKYVI